MMQKENNTNKNLTESQQTRKQALRLGHSYLQTVGFNGFSFQDLANDLGIRKASLHYYFSSKEDLGLALIEQYAHYFKIFMEKSANLTAIRQLEQWSKYCYGMSKDKLRLCPIGVLTCEFNTLTPKMQKQLVLFQSLQRKWAAQIVKKGVQEKKFRKNLDTKWAADIYLESIQGALQIARLHKKPALFQKSIRGLLKSFR